jgi:hypothetical protein
VNPLGGLVLDGLTALGNAGEDVLTVLVHVQLGDDDVGGGDRDGDALAVALVAGDLLNVDDELETVGGGDLALTALLGTAGDGNVVADTDGDGADLLGADCVRFRAIVVVFFFLFLFFFIGFVGVSGRWENVRSSPGAAQWREQRTSEHDAGWKAQRSEPVNIVSRLSSVGRWLIDNYLAGLAPRRGDTCSTQIRQYF